MPRRLNHIRVTDQVNSNTASDIPKSTSIMVCDVIHDFQTERMKESKKEIFQALLWANLLQLS